MFDKNLSKKIAEREEEINGETGDSGELKWNLVFLFCGFGVLVLILLYSVFSLQVFEGEDMYVRSQRNQIKVIDIQPRRGVIFDRDGRKLVENIPSVDCYIDIKTYFEDGVLNDEKLVENVKKLEGILDEDVAEYESILERIYLVLEKDSDVERILISSDLENEKVIEIKALRDELLGVDLEEGVKRHYIHKEPLSHILGYTGIVTSEDFERLDYVGLNDVVGRTGIEKHYDEYLIGEKGKVAVEVNALGQVVSEGEALLKDAVSGQSLHSSIDLGAQKKAYEILSEGVKEYEAVSGSIIIQDVDNGEILVMANYPSFDNNVFVGGVSQEDYEEILYADGNPISNKAVDSQVPPGSIFKPLVAAAALDAGAVQRDTIYLSRRGYTLSGGTPFQEFQNNAYGSLNLVDAIMLSSNIYFCEVIRGWDMNELVPYLKNFGIGKYTGVDIQGEGPGRLPSPENKVKLAKTTSPWLEPFWYPEGDSCNSVIGQGITTVTPIQAVNWVSAIANGGILHTPRLVKDFPGEKKDLAIGEGALEIVREGMRASVAGDRRVIFPLTDAKVDVAAKTGTAEFGALSEDGRYEQTHAWINGFFPYDEPQFSFVVFLENGGASDNSARLSREMIDWFVDNVDF